jgi:predicted DNA-binding transcriptional regulator AlpA
VSVLSAAAPDRLLEHRRSMANLSSPAAFQALGEAVVSRLDILIAKVDALPGAGSEPSPSRPTLPADRLAFRADELADLLGISRRALDRERSAGAFPQPDRIIGKMPLWSRETVLIWLKEGAK